jgi:hypothetical protein
MGESVCVCVLIIPLLMGVLGRQQHFWPLDSAGALGLVEDINNITQMATP